MFRSSLLVLVLLCALLGRAASEKPALVFWHGYGMSYNDVTHHVRPRNFVQAMRDLANSFYGETVVDPPVYSMAIGSSFSAPPRLAEIEAELKQPNPRSDMISSLKMDLSEQVIFGMNQLLQGDVYTYIQRWGFIAIGFSQGGVNFRGVLQMSEILSNHCVLFITYGSPHEGINGVPKEMLPSSVRKLGPEELEKFIQANSPFKHLSREPRAPRLRSGSLLVTINNPLAACNLLKLKAFAMYMFTEDAVVRPVESQVMKLDSSLDMLDIAVFRFTIDGGHLDFSNAPGWASEAASFFKTVISGSPRDASLYVNECLKHRSKFHSFITQEAKQTSRQTLSKSEPSSTTLRHISETPSKQGAPLSGTASTESKTKTLSGAAAKRLKQIGDHLITGLELNEQERKNLAGGAHAVSRQQLSHSGGGGDGSQTAVRSTTTEAKNYRHRPNL